MSVSPLSQGILPRFTCAEPTISRSVDNYTRRPPSSRRPVDDANHQPPRCLTLPLGEGPIRDRSAVATSLPSDRAADGLFAEFRAVTLEGDEFAEHLVVVVGTVDRVGPL